MSYRDDLGAAQARAEAAERRAEALQRRVDELERAQVATRDEGTKAAHEQVRRVPIPERFEVVLGDRVMRVSWRWFRAREHLFMLLFCMVWDGALLAGVVGAYVDNKWEWGMLLGIGHVIIGIVLTYWVLAGLFNRTTVSAASGRLRIEHGPLPWRGNRDLQRADLRQLYVLEHTTENDGSKSIKYELCAVLDDNRQIKLIKGLEELAQGRYLEHALELHMGIKDGRVPDEAPKR